MLLYWRALVAGLLVAAPLYALVSEAAAKAPFRLLYNSDAMNVWTCGTPPGGPNQPLTDASIAATIDEVAALGVDAYLLTPGWGHWPWTQNERMHEHFRWWQETTGREPDQYGQYLLSGGDWLRVLVERCRHHDLAAFVSFRVNDAHFMEYAGEDHPRSFWTSRFYTEHPHYWIDPEHKVKWPGGYRNQRGLNWAEPAVRAEKLALIAEFCRGYDLDGVELDFLRDHVLFRPEFPAAERIELITEFVGQVRRLLNETERGGRRRWLSVRVPLDLGRWSEIGLEPSRLVAAGVDMFNCSGWYHTVAAPDLAALRAVLPDVALYQELTHSAGTMWFLADRTAYGTASYPRTTDTQFQTVANLAYARGADGISLFNFAYYRLPTPSLPWLQREPPFHIVPRLRDPAWLARQSQHYWLGQWTYHNQTTSRRLRPGQPRSFWFDVALPNVPIAELSRLRLHTAELIEGTIDASFNGVPLVRSDDLSAFDDNPYDVMLSDAARRRAWKLPLELVRDGRNDLVVDLTGTDQEHRVTWVDFAVPTQAGPVSAAGRPD